ncbi:MAG: DUF1002 domain-containing protein [Kurthia gibsonii]|uniref:DUF1002 domain-containing protein n=1 Tax=Kurthia gibsonii TaxID=33946 RepID=A0ABU9LM08_9BACL|nr:MULTISPECIES: DUF1002 domain-containing protein [Kurthia]MCA9724195.1 DUF1002 domain-containing protein [Kurthia sp.]MEB7772834.1 DUF1002 domain-containing protein [Kurthia gibsonii]RXH52075.1 DUF1002 domain-containing protein [Kurthia gibsonii]WIL38309.1 DUF1002 domain-containing protein [Kurthia sp. YJT4]GED19607.1 hypothetical protein KGI01_13480 [Kurthia gibsonii]
MKKQVIAVVAAIGLATTSIAAPTISLASTATQTNKDAVNEKLGVPIAVYGDSLTADEKEKVKKSLNVAADEETEEITVTGADIAKYIQDGNPRARLYSSAKITPQDKGKGLAINIVTPDDITEVTSDMYANAMLTAGVDDAKVDVAAPKPVTGHSALAGIYKAYESTTGKKLDKDRTDVANQELNVATGLAKNSNVSDEKVSQLLTEIKQEIAKQKPATKEEVAQIVDDKLSTLNIQLSDQDRQMLVDLMDKISKLDIDFGKWSSQLDDLNNTIKDKLDNIKNDINSDTGFWASVKNFFQNLVDTVKGWFN